MNFDPVDGFPEGAPAPCWDIKIEIVKQDPEQLSRLERDRVFTKQKYQELIYCIRGIGVKNPKGILHLLQKVVVIEQNKSKLIGTIQGNANDASEAQKAIKKKTCDLQAIIRVLMEIHGGPWPYEGDDDFIKNNPLVEPLPIPSGETHLWLSTFYDELREWMQANIPIGLLVDLSKAVDACADKALKSNAIQNFKEVANYRDKSIPGTLRTTDLSDDTIQAFGEISKQVQKAGCFKYMKSTADLFGLVGISVDLAAIRKRLQRMKSKS